MEAGGHYYTVYYTSLAVGYTQQIAYRQALLAQMPDQVSWLDASHMQQTEAMIRGNWSTCSSTRYEVNLNGNCSRVTSHERARIQAGLHSLVPNHLNDEIKSSTFQRRFTVDKLMDENPASLKFGLLLHRLGDSFAHSRIDDNSKMYGISSDSLFMFTNPGESAGHLFDMHDPDYPFLRTRDIFFPYLQQLYYVLSNKLNEKNNQVYKRPNYTPVTYNQLKAVFEGIFMNLATRQKQFGATHYIEYHSRATVIKKPRQAGNVQIADWYIDEVRKALARIKGVKNIETYAPEKQNLMSLREFLNSHPELGNLNISANNVNDAINDIIPGGENSLLPVPSKPISERAYDYVKETQFIREMERELQGLTRPPGFP